MIHLGVSMKLPDRDRLRLLWLALGGIIPFLSFFFESRIPREVKGYLSGREAAAAAEPVESMQ